MGTNSFRILGSKFVEKQISLCHFWYTNFWDPDPSPTQPTHLSTSGGFPPQKEPGSTNQHTLATSAFMVPPPPHTHTYTMMKGRAVGLFVPPQHPSASVAPQVRGFSGIVHCLVPYRAHSFHKNYSFATCIRHQLTFFVFLCKRWRRRATAPSPQTDDSCVVYVRGQGARQARDEEGRQHNKTCSGIVRCLGPAYPWPGRAYPVQHLAKSPV